MRADDETRPAGGEACELGPAGTGKRHVENRAHRRPNCFDRERIDRLADKDSAARTDGIDGPDDRPEIARIADALERNPYRARARLDRGEGRERLLEHADHGLRVLAARDLLEHGFAHRDHLPAAGMGRRGEPRHERGVGNLCRIEELADRPPRFNGVGDQLQAFGDEQSARLPVLAEGKAADLLHQRIGEAGDVQHFPRDRRALVSSHPATTG